MSELEPGEPQIVESDELEQQQIPRWVPVLIGLVLVGLAALAVYTGVRYRMNPLTDSARHVREPRASHTVPAGEPQPGASLVFPGEGGENVPAANEPVTGNARAIVTGSPTGVNAVVRMWARRGMMITADPEDAMVSVNEMPVGQASQFDTRDEIYDFAAAGSYNIRVSAPGYVDRTYVVTASDDAKDEIATIKVTLARAR